METAITVPPSANISIDIKGKDFYVTDSYLFMLITADGQQNQICIFDDDITDKARDYANSKTPAIREITIPSKDSRDFIGNAAIDYWSKLFHLFIWNLLAEKNTITYMKASKE